MWNLFFTFEPIIVEVSSEQASGWAGAGRALPASPQAGEVHPLYCALCSGRAGLRRYVHWLLGKL